MSTLFFYVQDRFVASRNYGLLPHTQDLELGPNIRDAIRTLPYGKAIQIRWKNSTDIIVHGRKGEVGSSPAIVKKFRRRDVPRS